MEPERRASASAAEPSGVTPERSSLCRLLPVLSEIQTLVERSNIINVSVASPHPPLLVYKHNVPLWNKQIEVKLVEFSEVSTRQMQIALIGLTFEQKQMTKTVTYILIF